MLTVSWLKGAHKELKKRNTTAFHLIISDLVYFVASYGLEALKMNMLSGAGAARLGGVGGSSSSSSSSVSSSLWSGWYASNSLLFTKTQTEVRQKRRKCFSCIWTAITTKVKHSTTLHSRKTARVAHLSDVRNTYTSWSRVILTLRPTVKEWD